MDLEKYSSRALTITKENHILQFRKSRQVQSRLLELTISSGLRLFRRSAYTKISADSSFDKTLLSAVEGLGMKGFGVSLPKLFHTHTLIKRISNIPWGQPQLNVLKILCTIKHNVTPF